MNKEKIRKILGDDFVVEKLKPEGRITQNQNRPKDTRQPTVDLIITSDGRKFKIHEVPSDKNIHMLRILDMLELYEKTKFIPKIVYTDEYYIILEYIEGNFPNLTDDCFAIQYAENLAFLHSLDVGWNSVSDFMMEIESALDYLTSKKMFKSAVANNIKSKLNEIKPNKIKTSMIYADLTAQNFVSGSNGTLYFIDLGSFQRGKVTDQFLLSSKLYDGLNQELFKASYLESGGDKYIFENKLFLQYASKINMSATLHESIKMISLFDWRKRRSRQKKVEFMINELKGYFS